MSLSVETPSGAPLPGQQPEEAEVRTYRSQVPQVDLLPPEILSDRRFRRLRGQLIGLVVGVVGVCVGGVVWAQLGLASVQEDLATVRDQGARLEREQAKYADVPRTLAELDQVKAAREAALGTDVLWYQFLGDLALNTPRDTELSSITISMAGSAGESAVVPSPLVPSGLGSVSVTGIARRFPDVASWLEDVNEVHGLTGSALDSASRSDTGADAGTTEIKFAGNAVIESSALSHRYDRKAD